MKANIKSDRPFNAVKVFSATMAADRAEIGEVVTRWMNSRPGIDIVDVVVTQSSDSSFHMLAMTVFYQDPRPHAERDAEGKQHAAEREARSSRRLSFKEGRP